MMNPGTDVAMKGARLVRSRRASLGQDACRNVLDGVSVYVDELWGAAYGRIVGDRDPVPDREGAS